MANDAAQDVLDKLLYTQSVHTRDAHSGQLTLTCATCIALHDTVRACQRLMEHAQGAQAWRRPPERSTP
jgi:hypothetical protein